VHTVRPVPPVRPVRPVRLTHRKRNKPFADVDIPCSITIRGNHI